MPVPSNDPSKGSPDRAEILRRAGPYLGIGSTFLGAVGFCTFAGWWLDSKLGTSPWLTVAGALAGVGTGFYMFFRTVLGASRGNGDS